ncbi:MAG: AAA family ATPase [Chloroflexota bacterium]
MTQQTQTSQTDSQFQDHILKALENFSKPRLLGQESPLAAPYLVGEYLADIPTTLDDDERRGMALQQLLRDAVADMERKGGDNGKIYAQLIEFHYFQRLNSTKSYLAMNVGKTTFFKHKQQFIPSFCDALLSILKPALSIEKPPRTQPIIGPQRRQIIQESLQSLRQKETVAILGSSGMGKTTLASAVTQQLDGHPIFWYTLRAGLNDRPSSFLFELGFFCHQHGSRLLWMQLVDDIQKQTQIDLDKISATMRHAITTLGAKAIPILCIDEIEILRDAETDAHAQLTRLLESLRGLAGIILIGQQIHMHVDQQHTLRGFQEGDTRYLFERANIRLATEQIKQIQTYTQGNPRLLELFMILYNANQRREEGTQTFDDILNTMPQNPSVEFLFKRVWTYLSEAERGILLFLSVFQKPAPLHHGYFDTETQRVFHHLVEHQLIHQHGDHCAILAVYRTILYEQLLSQKEREEFHHKAAVVYEGYASYTHAAYHYIQANEFDHAVTLWWQNHEHEINQGQSQFAYELFDRVSTKYVEPDNQQVLACIRTKLLIYAGNLSQASKELEQTVWTAPVLTIERHQLAGYIANSEDNLSKAIDAYQHGLALATSWHPYKVPLLRKELAWSYRLSGLLDKAESEIFTAAM